MNAAHWHLVVNHLPIVFPLVGIIVLLIGWVAKSEAVKRTALVIFILGALTAVAAMGTGDEAEDVVENLPGVSENYIESHEEAAELFALLAYLLGGTALLGLWASFKQRAFWRGLQVVTLLFAAVVMFFAKQTGTTGGEIRHSEIRAAGSLEVNPDRNVSGQIEMEEEEDD